MRGPKLTVYPKGVLLETYRRRLIALRDDGFNDDFMAALEEVHRQLEKHDALAARLAQHESGDLVWLSRAEFKAMEARLAECEAERLEQALLNGKGSEREARLLARLDEALRLLRRYRTETPLGHQPHMIAHEADAVLRTADSAKPAHSCNCPAKPGENCPFTEAECYARLGLTVSEVQK